MFYVSVASSLVRESESKIVEDSKQLSEISSEIPCQCAGRWCKSLKCWLHQLEDLGGCDSQHWGEERVRWCRENQTSRTLLKSV